MLEDLDRVQKVLPRILSNSMTIAVMLKRKLEYKNAYLFVNIQPCNIMLDLNDLCKTPLYMSVDVTVYNKWEEVFNKDINIETHGLLNIEPYLLIRMRTHNLSMKQWFMVVDKIN